MVRLHRVCVAMHVPVAQILTRDRRFLFHYCGNPSQASEERTITIGTPDRPVTAATAASSNY